MQTSDTRSATERLESAFSICEELAEIAESIKDDIQTARDDAESQAEDEYGPGEWDQDETNVAALEIVDFPEERLQRVAGIILDLRLDLDFRG